MAEWYGFTPSRTGIFLNLAGLSRPQNRLGGRNRTEPAGRRVWNRPPKTGYKVAGRGTGWGCSYPTNRREQLKQTEVVPHAPSEEVVRERNKHNEPRIR